MPRQYKFNRVSSHILDREIGALIERKVVSPVVYKSSDRFLYNIFRRPMPNGKHRMILDQSKQWWHCHKTFQDDTPEYSHKAGFLGLHYGVDQPKKRLLFSSDTCTFPTVSLLPVEGQAVPVQWSPIWPHFSPWDLHQGPKACFFWFQSQRFAYLDDSFMIGRTFAVYQEGIKFLVNSLLNLEFKNSPRKIDFRTKPRVYLSGVQT